MKYPRRSRTYPSKRKGEKGSVLDVGHLAYRIAPGAASLLILVVTTMLLRNQLVAPPHPDDRITPPRPRISRLTPSASITAFTGQTIRGLHIECTTNQPAVTIPTGVNHVTIEDNEIGPCSSGVVGIYASSGSSDIYVRYNMIHSVASGFWASHAHHPIVFEHNTVLDVLGPSPRGQMIQLDNVRTGRGQTRIVGNVSDWFTRTRRTHYEDHINTYMSSGSAENPILIQGNKIRGGDSTTGSAIVIGDRGGNWYEIRDNIVVAVPNTGIAHVGGGNFRTIRNQIYNVYGPEIQTASGMTVWNTYDVYLEDNRVIASYCVPGGDCDRHMGFWRGPNIRDVTEVNNDWFDRTLDADIWDQEWTESGWR